MQIQSLMLETEMFTIIFVLLQCITGLFSRVLHVQQAHSEREMVQLVKKE